MSAVTYTTVASSEDSKEFSGCKKCGFLSLLSEELLASQEELFPPPASDADVLTEVPEITNDETAVYKNFKVNIALRIKN